MSSVWIGSHVPESSRRMPSVNTWHAVGEAHDELEWTAVYRFSRITGMTEISPGIQVLPGFRHSLVGASFHIPSAEQWRCSENSEFDSLHARHYSTRISRVIRLGCISAR